MSRRLNVIIGLASVLLGSTAASASQITVTSYDMDNGNGATQFTTPTGGQDYFDFTYTKTGQSTPDPKASVNGSASSIPTNANANNALLSGGTGKLTDGVIASDNFSLVSGTNNKISNGWTTAGSPYYGSLNGQPTQYVGWKYQDPTIIFNLTPNHSVSQIKLYVAADNSLGLVGAPGNVTVTVGNSLLSSSLYTEVTTPYKPASNPYAGSTDVITITLDQSVSSNAAITLQLFRGPLEADGIAYYNDHVNGNICDAAGCFVDTISGFQQNAWVPQLEPWIMLSEVQFFSAAVPEISTWLMLLIGFLTLGFVAQKRHGLTLRSASVR